MRPRIIIISAVSGLAATVLLLVVFFGVVGIVSGWRATTAQFSQYGFYIVGLSVGFGIQIGLYRYMRLEVTHMAQERTVAAFTGTTSTAAMISCCAHYLANIVPILGITGLVTIVTQYQVRLFWVGILLNVLGIAFMLYRLFKISRHG